MNSSETWHRLTDDGKLKFAPVFSSAEQVVYAVHENPNMVALKAISLKDGSQQLLHPSLTASQFDPAFSRDGRYHCFIKSGPNPQLVLVLQDRETGQESVVIPEGGQRATARNPSISAGRKRVAFTFSATGGQQIASVDMQGRDLKRLTASPGLNATPDFSPDGETIAFSSSRDGPFEIYLMSAEGENVRRLTNSPGLDLRPRWSPQGGQIAFTSNRDGNYEVYVMNSDGSGLRRVTNHPERDDYPTWHPDGKHLLIVSERRGKSDLYLIEMPE